MEPVFEKLKQASLELHHKAIRSLEDAGMHEQAAREPKLYSMGEAARQKRYAIYEKVGTKEVEWSLEEWDGCTGKPKVWVYRPTKKRSIILWTWDMEGGIRGVYSDGQYNGDGHSFFFPGLDMDEAKSIAFAYYRSL